MSDTYEPLFDPADYDTDDRVRCRGCGAWAWGTIPDEQADLRLCPACEERYCAECMPAHACFTEGPS